MFKPKSSYEIITTPEQVQELSEQILSTLPYPVLGVDCEGLSKGRPLCLL